LNFPLSSCIIGDIGNGTISDGRHNHSWRRDMRTARTVLFILILTALTAPARPAAVNELAIYADREMTTWCADGTPPYLIDMWVYLIVGEGGAMGFSFDLEIPFNVEVLSIDVNRYEEPILCLPPDCDQGIAGVFGPCYTLPRFPLVWVLQATLNVLDPSPSVVRIVDNPVSGDINVQRCDLAFERPPILTDLLVNYPASAPECGVVAVEESTWGAIKALCR